MVFEKVQGLDRKICHSPYRSMCGTLKDSLVEVVPFQHVVDRRAGDTHLFGNFCHVSGVSDKTPPENIPFVAVTKFP